MNPIQCGGEVYWFDSNHTSHCILDRYHGDAHTDGLQFWDDCGLRVPAISAPPQHRFRPIEESRPHAR